MSFRVKSREATTRGPFRTACVQHIPTAPSAPTPSAPSRPRRVIEPRRTWNGPPLILAESTWHEQTGSFAKSFLNLGQSHRSDSQRGPVPAQPKSAWGGTSGAANSVPPGRDRSPMTRGHSDRPLHRPKLSVDPWSAGEAIERISVFQEKHEGFGKILARTGRCIIGDEVIPKPPRSYPLHRLLRSAALCLNPIPSTLGKPLFPSLVGPRLAISIRGIEHRFEPTLPEKVAIQIMPSMSEFMPDDIGQRASGCSSLGGKIAGQIDHARSVPLVTERPRLLKDIP